MIDRIQRSNRTATYGLQSESALALAAHWARSTVGMPSPLNAGFSRSSSRRPFSQQKHLRLGIGIVKVAMGVVGSGLAIFRGTVLVLGGRLRLRCVFEIQEATIVDA